MGHLTVTPRQQGVGMGIGMGYLTLTPRGKPPTAVISTPLGRIDTNSTTTKTPFTPKTPKRAPKTSALANVATVKRAFLKNRDDLALEYYRTFNEGAFGGKLPAGFNPAICRPASSSTGLAVTWLASYSLFCFLG